LEADQHILSRNFVIVHDKVAIVLTVVPPFRSNVAHFNPWKRLMVVVPNRNNKSVKSMIFAFDHELGENASMVSEDSQITDPPLSSFAVWSIHDKTFTCLVIGGSSHQTFDVRAVTQLSLGIAPDELISFSWFKKHLDLLIVTKVSEGDDEHRFVQTQRHLLVEKQRFL
jgi:hypothetical protein